MPDFQKFYHYKESIEIDYFTYFSKCYFALNAYIKEKYDGNDRGKIDALKDEKTIINRFNELLNNAIFCSNLKEFKQALYEAQIKNNNELISFEKVKIKSFQDTLIKENKNSIRFNLNICAGKDEKVKFQCIDSKGNQLCEEECKYVELEQKLNQTKLSEPQRKTIKSLFDNKIAQYHKNLIEIIDNIQSNENNDRELLYKGLIEIIYQLRNALFHSQIDPKQDNVHKVYKIAYFLLKDVIYKLPTEERR